MSDIYFFQRYSQKENWLTNNTLMLLQHFYNNDAKRFEGFLKTLFEEQVNIDVGPVFKQQVKGENSIPDGYIFQPNFNIIIEAKKGGELYQSQILNHAKSFSDKERNIILALTKEHVSEEKNKQIKLHIKTIAQNAGKKIHFSAITYEELISLLRETIMPHELSFLEILDDYQSFCIMEDVISTEKHTMLVVSAGTSFSENVKYGIYYDPIDRNHKIPFKYLGLYLDKSIRALGEVESIVGCNYLGDELKPIEGFEEAFQKLTDAQNEKIKNIINNTDYYDLKSNTKFIVVDKFHVIDYKKSESGGVIRSKSYKDLTNVDGFEEGMSSGELADLLDGREWG